MDIIIYECLKGFHRRFTETDSKPELHKLNAFTNLMQNDYSGENLIEKIITTDEHWDNMLNTKGFGRGVKYNKAKTYREELITKWNTIDKAFKTKNEAKISQVIGLYIWDLEEDEFTHSFLGVIQEAINQKKLWKSPVTSDIFCSFFGFTKSPFKSLDQIAKEHNLDKERVRQLKDKCLDSFEKNFWFLKDNLIREKLENLFDLSSHKLEQINEQTERVNRIEVLGFTSEFYTKMLSIAFDMVLIGNINDIKIQNRRSINGNIWNNLYLQTQLENERCNLEVLIDTLAIEMHKNHYFFEKDTVVDISPFTSISLTVNEIERYNSIIAIELELEVELKSYEAIIKRNSHITQTEMVENALKELGGLAYADDILEKVIENSSEKKWNMRVLRASFRGENFYSVGKSGLFGLKNKKDVRNEIGDGTLNEIIYIFMSRKESPVHIHELLNHINKLFPRPKTLSSINTILGQNNKAYFKKFKGGFYGLAQKEYENTEFPRVVGGHSAYMRQIIEDSDGVDFKDIFVIFNNRYGLLEIQVRYLLHHMISTHKISLINGQYQHYVHTEVNATEENDNPETPFEEIDTKLDQEELDLEELNQPDIPEELLRDAVAQIKIRRGQPKFRLKLLKFYKKTCIVTGCNITKLLEASHVLPHADKKDFSLSNGLLLRADIHTLFDLSMLAIDPDSMQLKLNESLMESCEYAKLNNIDIGARLNKLHPKYKINKEGLYRRWESFIELELKI